MVTLQSTVAEFKALATEYGVTLIGDGRKKETKQRWIDELKAIHAVKSKRPDDHQIMLATAAYSREGSSKTGKSCFEFVRDRLNQEGLACSETYLSNRVRKIIADGNIEQTAINAWRLSTKGYGEMIKDSTAHQLYVPVIDGKVQGNAYTHYEYISGKMYQELNSLERSKYKAIVCISPSGFEVVSSVSSQCFEPSQVCQVAGAWKNPRVQTAIAYWERYNKIMKLNQLIAA